MLKLSTPSSLRLHAPGKYSWRRRLGTTFFLFMSLTALTSAQTKLWEKYLGADRLEFVTAFQQTPDGGYIVGGSSAAGISADKSQPSRGGKDYWIIKLDANRNKVWDKTFGGAGNDRLSALQLTRDGGYLLGGLSDSGKSGDKSQASQGKSDYWIVKIDASGNKVWDKTYGGNYDDRLSQLKQTQDGGFILGGFSASGKSGDKSHPNWGSLNQSNVGYKGDFWIVKLNASGNKVWDKTFGGADIEYFSSLQQTQDGGYILGGTSFSDISGDKTEMSRDDPSADAGNTGDYWVVKLKSDGSKVWDKTIGGDYDDGLAVIRQTSDGGYMLSGSSHSPVSGDKSDVRLEGDYSFDFSDYWIVKLDATGKKIWDRTHGGGATDRLASLERTSDDGYILAGASSSPRSDIMKLNNNGDKVWGKEFTPSDPASLDLMFISQTKDGSYLAAGSDVYKNGYYIAKLAQNKPQTITFSTISTKVYSSQTFTLTAKASTGLPVTFEVKSGEAKINGNRLTLTGIGAVTVIAYQDGNETYAPAETSQNFQVVAAPTQGWSYGGSDNDNFTTLIKTADGGYLSGGYTNSGQNGDKTQASQGKNDYWIVKSDVNGKKLWDKRYGGSGEDYLNHMIQTQDGGYLLAGSSFSSQNGDKSQISRGGRDYWIVKTDAQGNKEWDKRYGGTGSDELKKVLQLASGRYILAGSSNSPQSGDKSQNGKGGQDYWLLKISPNGQKVWDRTYGGSQDDLGEDVAVLSNGDLLLGGSSQSSSSGDRTQGNRGASDYWVLHLDGNGQKVWDRRFGGAREDKLMALGATATGNIYLVGTSASQNSGDKSQTSQGGSDYWIVQISATGSKLWDKAYGGSQDEELRSVILTNDNGYLLAGSSNSGVSGDKTQESQGNSDYWVVKTDKAGKVEWDQRKGGSGKEELRAALLTSDNGYLLAGRSNSGVSGDRIQTSQGGTDYWLVKITAPTNSLVATRTASLSAEPIIVTPSVIAYPNPFQEKVTVSFTLPETQTATVRVLDSQGRKVKTLFQGEVKASQTYQLEWQAGNKEAGMYLLQLQTPTQQNTQKLLLTK